MQDVRGCRRALRQENAPCLERISVLADIKFQVCPFLDALRFLVVQHQSRGEEQRLVRALSGHTTSALLHPNKPPRDFELILTLVNPDPVGKHQIAACPWLIPREGEVALNWHVDDKHSARVLHRFCDQHLVHPWHGTQETYHDRATTYTAPPHRSGRGFAVYSDLPSKLDSKSDCCHIEARYHGIGALRGIGISTAGDWLSFDQHAFWKKNLVFYEIDLSRLGRWYDNSRTGKRRHQTRQHLSGYYSYNIDRAMGSVLFRNFGRHSTEPEITVQRFVDCFGRGPFLRLIDSSRLLPAPKT